jgi:hypothetical protein
MLVGISTFFIIYTLSIFNGTLLFSFCIDSFKQFCMQVANFCPCSFPSLKNVCHPEYWDCGILFKCILTKISALDSFPIFTLFFISDTFFCFSVCLSKSYMALSSERVNITLQPLCSNSFCTFNVIFRFVWASVVPLLDSAPWSSPSVACV